MVILMFCTKRKIWIMCFKVMMMKCHQISFGSKMIVMLLTITTIGIIYLHTHLNTTVYVGITTTKSKKRQKYNLPKPTAHSPSRAPPNITAVIILS